MTKLKFLLIIVIVISIRTSVQAQFNFDKTRIESIRWTPNPNQVAGLAKHVIDLNGNWKFSVHPENEFFKNEINATWDNIEVPGEWVMQGFKVEPGNFAGYTRNFEILPSWKSYRIKLKCESVYSEGTIWVNGKEVGSHLGGFTPFEFDVTEFVTAGLNNIAVAVKSESLADTLSSASQYAVHPLGGISRSISLMALPEVNIASFHVSTNFDADFEDADLNVEITIANESSKAKEASLNFTLTDSKGKAISLVGGENFKIDLAKAQKKKFATSFKVKNPLKWDCEHPILHFLSCKVIVDGKEVKNVIRRFGFRQIDIRGNQVFVNNEPIKLKGVCRHEVDPLRGRSLTGNQWYDDVKLFKEGNVNYIRTSHYPPNEKLLEACDELGMFVEEEAPFCWAKEDPVTDGNYFEAILQPTLEMVERDKSHPSVIQWSLGNESENFEELFKISGDLVKEADPTRPRIFSQYGEDSDGGYLELGNHHYPGSSGPAKYRNNRRPVSFDEYCHLNAYNRFELMTDPGVRDFWGDILFSMWEDMYASKGVLGGALWAGIDDSFFLPDGHVVGYGTWGPVDGWRRPKPEYWHMKKIFSPVKIKFLDGDQDSLVTVEIENRYLFSNLNECRIFWKNGTEQGFIQPDINAGEKQLVKLPIRYNSIEKLYVDVWKDTDVPVDQYLFDFEKPSINFIQAGSESFKWISDNSAKQAESSKLKVSFNTKELVVWNQKGEKIIDGWPGLMLTPFNNGGDTQMTKETPDYTLFSPAANNRKIESVEIKRNTSEIQIIVNDSYKEAVGKEVICIFADGRIEIEYEYKLLSDVNLRQWGITFSLPQTMSNFSWKKKGLWSVYPEDHIGRLEGAAKLFYSHSNSGLAGPEKKPTWSYSQDQTIYGSNDFRSTKRNVLFANLISETNSGLKIVSDGLQHIRCWAENNKVNVLVAEFDNPGSERFLRGFANHASKFDQPLKQGQSIKGKIRLYIVN